MHGLWESWDVYLVSFILCATSPFHAYGMFDTLETVQEVHKPKTRGAVVSFTNSLLQCTGLSFSLVLGLVVLVLGTQNSTECGKCNSIQQTFIEHACHVYM